LELGVETIPERVGVFWEKSEFQGIVRLDMAGGIEDEGAGEALVGDKKIAAFGQNTLAVAQHSQAGIAERKTGQGFEGEIPNENWSQGRTRRDDAMSQRGSESIAVAGAAGLWVGGASRCDEDQGCAIGVLSSFDVDGKTAGTRAYGADATLRLDVYGRSSRFVLERFENR
jgi:hypothetical protein